MSNEIQFLLYNLPDKEGRVQVVIKDETIWCTQKAMAELFGIDKSGISRHIANIFKEEELQQDTTVAKIATVVNRGIKDEDEDSSDERSKKDQEILRTASSKETSPSFFKLIFS